MNASWCLQTGRLLLTPVHWSDLADLVALKGDPRAYAVMLGGVRSQAVVADELAQEISDWARLGYGMWVIRLVSTSGFVGVVGLQERADGRGVGLRFALMPGMQGNGFASEAASAALRFGHERAGLVRITAVAREDNFSSRQVIGSIGMRELDAFSRGSMRMLVFVSELTDTNR